MKLLRNLLNAFGNKSPAPTTAVTPEHQSLQTAPQRLPNAPEPVVRFRPEVSLPVRPASDSLTKISFVLIVYKMSQQAEKTLLSLSAGYQRGVTEEDYEVIVVENSSNDILGEERACQYGNNVRYFYREEPLPSPVPAVNFGATQASGTHISIMVDGARMLSPGVVSYTLAATRLHPAPVVAIPGYHLGPKLQQHSMLEGYGVDEEIRLLKSIRWPDNGYCLFEISCLSGTSGGGYFKPIGESNCLCVTRDAWEQLGGFDPAFTETGGGQVNLDFYKRAVELPDSGLVILIGEVSFHQFHGGITTGTQGEVRKKAMGDHFNQYAALRGGPYRSPTKRPIYLGSVPDSAMPFMHIGTTQAVNTLRSGDS